MATASTIALTPSTSGIAHTSQQTLALESSQRVTKLLQKNHDEWHMYFNTSGFHNHIAHHLLTVFALGASPDQLQYAYDTNASYQRPQFPVHKDIVESMSDPATFEKYLNQEQYFHDYEDFFRSEIERLGWGPTVAKYLLDDTNQARDLLARLYGGVYHPAIHLGFGIEFEQPAIIVEALAMAATHGNDPKVFYTKTDELAKQRSGPSASMFELIEEVRNTPKLRDAPKASDSSRLRQGVFGRAMDEITQLCSKWHVQPTDEELKFKTAEMINACAYFTGAAQHSSRKKQVKMDFFYIHAMNSSLFYSTFLDSKHNSWLDNRGRVRLLEYKARMDLAVYTAFGSPELLLDEIKSYKPREPSEWGQIFNRANALEDDGHASKLVRALAHGELVCKEFEHRPEAEGWTITGKMWLQLGHMAIDSVSSKENTSQKWVRGAGFESAWEKIPARL